MRLFYLDTSVILKRYKQEPGSENIDYLYATSSPSSKTLVTSLFSGVEIASACRRLLNGGEISGSDYDGFLASYVIESESIFRLLSVQDSTLASATGYVRKHSLRPGDAIHLSSAMNAKRLMLDHGCEVDFIASDALLCKSAEDEGMRVIDLSAIGKEEWRKMVVE